MAKEGHDVSKNRVLVLCTGNSCRSHMAEGLINHFLGDEWQAYSAGTQPAGYVHPLAIKVMDEIGIDISDHVSKSAEQFRDMELDWVITVCDDAAENCPVWLGLGNKAHFGYPDPAEAEGSDGEKLIVFRQVRDDLRLQLSEFLPTVA